MPTNVKLYLTTGENMTEDDRLKITLDSIAADTFPPSSHDHNASDIIDGTLNADRLPTIPIAKLSDLQIGGRNLLLDSDRYVKTSDYLMIDYPFSEDLIQGEVFTISIRGNLNDLKSAFRFYGSGSVGTFLIVGNESKNSEGIYVKTFTIPYSVYKSNEVIRLYNFPNTITAESEIEWIKLERGNKATDWTPAPEDLISKAELLDESNNIKLDYIPVIPINRGGTGATTASEARTNLNAQLAHARLTALSNVVVEPNQGDGRFLKLLTGDSFAIDYNTYVTSTYLTTNYYNKSQTNNEINTKIANLVDSAPGTLDTLNELAAALGNDPNFATTVTNTIATKVPLTRSIAGLTLENDITSASLTSVLDLATTSKRGLMSGDDKTKLNGLIPTQDLTDNSTKLATTSLVWGLIGGKRMYHLTQSEYTALGSSKDPNGIYFIRGT